MRSGTVPSHWLDDYASKKFEWREFSIGGRRTFRRRLGLVEFTFDADGRHHEGRADINNLIELEVRSTLSRDALKKRILLAWAALRCHHWLLQAKALPTAQDDRLHSITDIDFVIETPNNPSEALTGAEEHIVFLDSVYNSVEPYDFWLHSQNATRIIEPSKALAKAFVFPLESRTNGNFTLRCLIVGSHQICDGLSMYVWLRDFVDLLNDSHGDLEDSLRSSLDTNVIRSRLPLPQEALYPPISGNKARQRWYWLLTRVLRHVRRPLQAGFRNPLRRTTGSRPTVALSPTYAAVLDYSRPPMLNSMPAFVTVPMRNTSRLHRLCREAKVSIGAGCFALSALVMMEMYETLDPGVPLSERKPFISGFPLNPRAFFNHHNEPDSLMLAFSDGIALPFLSSSLDLDGRLRLLARQAQRQLAAYQKRSRPSDAHAELQYMGSRGAGRVLSIQYVSSVERIDNFLPEHLRRNINPQGGYPMRPNMSMQTCGVSSVGRRDAVIRRKYDVHNTTKDFVADYRAVTSGVRARDGECLIGIGGDDDGLYVNASIDASSIGPGLVQLWADKLEHVLDADDRGRTGRL